MGKRIQIIAGGFPNRYGGVANEFRLSRKEPSEWFPTTDDFRATARLSGGGTGEAANFKHLLELIGKQSTGSIEALDLVGHAGNISLTIGQTTIGLGAGFALGGLVHGTRLDFTPGAMIHAESIKANMDAIKAVRDRFNTKTANACITLYACNAGMDKTFLDEVAGAFQVCVRGFNNEIFWCIKPTGKRTLGRGRTFYDPSFLASHPKDCEDFSPDIRRWIPENVSFGALIDI